MTRNHLTDVHTPSEIQTVAVINVEPVNQLKVAGDQRHLLSSGGQRHLVAIVGTSWTLGKVGPWTKLDLGQSWTLGKVGHV